MKSQPKYTMHSNGKKTTSFKEYYNDYLTLVKESPLLIANSKEKMDIIPYNKEHLKELIDRKEIIKIETIKFYNTINLDLYLEKIDDKRYLYCVDPDDMIINGYIYYRELQDGGVEELGIWNGISSAGIVRFLYLDWILKHYKHIMSDAVHSYRAKNMWETLFLQSSKTINKYKFYSYNTINHIKKNIDNLDDMKKQYGNSNQHFRLIIENS